MTTPALAVIALGGTAYTVSGGRTPHRVEYGATPSCDCKDFAYRGHVRPCKHLIAVQAFRDADLQGPLLDALDEDTLLDVVAPPERPAAIARTPDPDAVAVADAALALWRKELAVGKRRSTTFDALWIAACATMQAREALAAGQQDIAAGQCALARAVVEREAAA